MGIFGKSEEKGFDCKPNPDGSRTCKRYVKDKNGEMTYDGQEITVVADPENNCEASFDGDTRVLDSEWGKMNEVAKKVSAGCKSRAKKMGYSQG